MLKCKNNIPTLSIFKEIFLQYFHKISYNASVNHHEKCTAVNVFKLEADVKLRGFYHKKFSLVIYATCP